MNLGVVVEMHFYHDERGHFTPSNVRAPWWVEHTKYFDNIYIFSRCWPKDLTGVPQEDILRHPRIHVVPLPGFYGPVSFWHHRRGLRQIFARWQDRLDLVNLRGPGMITNLAISCFAGRVPTMATIVGDPEGVWNTERSLYRAFPPLWGLRRPISRHMMQAYRRKMKRVDCVVGVASYLAMKYRYRDDQPWGQVADTKLGDEHYIAPRPRQGNLKAVCAGRIWEYKNYQTFLKAVARAKQKGVTCDVEIIGEGYYLEPLKALARELGVAEQVRFPRRIDSAAELWRHYGQADISFLLSHSEGLPLAAIEAMAVGLPIMIADLPYADDIVRDGQEGFRVPPHDVEAAAERLIRWDHDESLRLEMARKAFQTARQFTIEKQVRHLAELAQQTVGGAAAPSGRIRRAGTHD